MPSAPTNGLYRPTNGGTDRLATRHPPAQSSAMHPARPTDRRRPPPGGPARGVTLIELLIATVVLAILMAVAVPTFQSSVRKSRRADAMAALTQIMQAQERYRANNSTYFSGSLSALPGAPASGLSADGHYTLSITEGSATAQGYTAVATAVSTSPQASDSQCAQLQVTLNGGSPPAYRSTNSGGSQNALPDPCWVR